MENVIVHSGDFAKHVCIAVGVAVCDQSVEIRRSHVKVWIQLFAC